MMQSIDYTVTVDGEEHDNVRAVETWSDTSTGLWHEDSYSCLRLRGTGEPITEADRVVVLYGQDAYSKHVYDVQDDPIEVIRGGTPGSELSWDVTFFVEEYRVVETPPTSLEDVSVTVTVGDADADDEPQRLSEYADNA